MVYLTLLVAALSILTGAEAKPVTKVRRQYSGTSVQNQLIDGTPCRAITVIFARGTFEQGNIGVIVGPYLAQQLVNDTSVDQIAFQGVDYPANVTGFLVGGDPDGSILMAQFAEQAYDQCPETNLVLSGYSQGAQLVHNAAALIDDCVTDFISSVVNFGDPDQTKPVGNIPDDKVLKICHDGDSICHGGYTITGEHLSYGTDNSEEAAQFIISHASL